MLGLDIDETSRQLMLRHLELLAHWNRRLNLTAITQPDVMVVQHLLDSLSVAPWIGGEAVLDIGSGGGLPGLPLAIAMPDRQFTLLDSRGKRIEFLRYVIANLGIKNVRVAQSRVEDYRPEVKFDTLVCRAFASLADILELTKWLQAPGVHLLAMKARAASDELHGVKTGRNWQSEMVSLQVPFLDADRRAVIFSFS